jgi:hypothetical protein
MDSSLDSTSELLLGCITWSSPSKSSSRDKMNKVLPLYLVSKIWAVSPIKSVHDGGNLIYGYVIFFLGLSLVIFDFPMDFIDYSR